MSKTLKQITIQMNPASGSVSELTRVSNSLNYGDSVAFPMATWGTSSAWTGPIFSWCTRWHWDPINRRGLLMCKEAESTGDGHHKLIIYTESTNSFSMAYDEFLTTGGGTGTGHGFDCAALDPATGNFYFMPLYAGSAIKWNGSGWDVATSPATTSGNTRDGSGPRGLGWMPAMNSSGGGLICPRASQIKSWPSYFVPPNTPWGVAGTIPGNLDIRYSQQVYCSGLGSMIATLGNLDKSAWLLSPGTGAHPLVTKLPTDLPAYCSSYLPSTGNKDLYQARMMPTPSGSVCILESASPGRVWRLDLSTTEWVEMPYLHPLRGSDTSWPTMYDSTHGVYWAIRANGGGDDPPDSVLWKPPAGL